MARFAALVSIAILAVSHGGHLQTKRLMAEPAAPMEPPEAVVTQLQELPGDIRGMLEGAMHSLFVKAVKDVKNFADADAIEEALSKNTGSDIVNGEREDEDVDDVEDAAVAAAVVGAQVPQQGIKLEIVDSAVNTLVAELSRVCGKRFVRMLLGKGPRLETFGDQSADDQSCQELDGAICWTTAHLIQEQISGSDDRRVVQKTEASGKGCLPKECMDDADLQLLAGFMHQQAQELIPGVQVDLNVDCSAVGGSLVAVTTNEHEVAWKNSAGPVAGLGMAMVIGFLAL